jgi:hypothetical protein
MSRKQDLLWVRVGNAGDYQEFGGEIATVIEYLNDCRAGAVRNWVNGPFGIGIETDNYHGQDLISLFWGDEEGNFVRELATNERRMVEQDIEEVYI